MVGRAREVDRSGGYAMVLLRHWWSRVTAVLNAVGLAVGVSARQLIGVDWPFLVAGLVASVFVAQWSAWKEKDRQLRALLSAKFEVDIEPVNVVRNGRSTFGSQEWRGLIMQIRVHNRTDQIAPLSASLRWLAGGDPVDGHHSFDVQWHSPRASLGQVPVPPRSEATIDAVLFTPLKRGVDAWSRECGEGRARIVRAVDDSSPPDVRVEQAFRRVQRYDTVLEVCVRHGERPDAEVVEWFRIEMTNVSDDKVEPRFVHVAAEGP